MLVLGLALGALAAVPAHAVNPISQLKPVHPAAKGTTPRPSTPRRVTEPSSMIWYLDVLLRRVNDYWGSVARANGLGATVVGYRWVPAGTSIASCGRPTNDATAQYCFPDDTVYISQKFAFDLWKGMLDGPGDGKPIGDFGLAYVVAHEYAHNLQNELGVYRARPDLPVRQFELQADCLAGTWAYSVYYRGFVNQGDITEAVSTALALGDFDRAHDDHHGTPAQRAAAWLVGYNGGDPRRCAGYVPIA